MPYLNNRRRTFLSHITTQIVQTDLDEPGELNYLFTLIARQYLKSMGENYTTYNAIIGALEACKMELYARKVRPYEDVKIKENGDVF